MDGGVHPEDYLWIADVVNPAAAYHARKHLVDDPPGLVEASARRRGLLRQARHWFRPLPGFVPKQAQVDGGFLGLDGVLGSVDFLLGDAVLEFKAEERAPGNPKEVVSQHPQDLEKLLFTARLLPGVGDRHFLAFFDRRDSTFAAFRVDVLDRALVHTLLRQRVTDLRRALRGSNPSELPRCRCFDGGCKFLEAGRCPCEKLDPIDDSVLWEAASITRDEELEWAMGKARGQAEGSAESIAWWHLLSPRRRYLPHDGSDVPPTPDMTQKVGREVLARCIQAARGIRPGSAAEREAWESAWDCGVSCAPDVVLARSTKRPGRVETRPYVVQAPKGPVQEAEDLFPSYVAELAIRCAKVGCPRGAAFLIYPDEGNEVVAYSVSFRGVQELRTLVEEQVEAIRTADRAEDPSLLPKCDPSLRDSCPSACLCRP